MSDAEPQRELQAYRDAMRRMNEWQRRNPIRLDAATAVRRISEMFDLIGGLERQRPVDPSHIQRMNEIWSKVPEPRR